MEIAAVNQFLTIFAWFPLAGFLGIMLMIARFYQRSSGDNTSFLVFIVPILLFGWATVLYAIVNQPMGDMLADGIMTLAGVVLLVMCVVLYRQMTSGR